MSPAITTFRRGHVAVVEMDVPPANFVDPATLEDLAQTLVELSTDGAVRAIVLHSGGKHFCAGVDFAAEGLGAERVAGARAFYGQAKRIFDIPVPLVAAVRGAAVGGGLGLACAADFRVVAENARLHANFAALGFHPGFALSVTLPHIVGAQHGAELLLAAERIDGRRAYVLGLADRVVAEDDVLDEAIAFAAAIAAQAPLAVRAIKATLRARIRDELASVLEHELQQQALLWQTEDSKIGIAASIARETPAFLGR
ncbi:enoyl-CoA hydratase/isomerase family protein [Microbacterium luticocti]|uniref:enoyl-CoA hydratase/isomerase family protein n=1 Tax=Microbacterium luticocti TaxID=451764 RepID=UPI000417CD3F|nr:enoyl-CoA hydratase/isomerase family protein [Microbacterium luticocti]